MCVPGLTIKPITCTADVEAVMRSAAQQQHAEASHLVLSVYVACKERGTGGALGFTRVQASHCCCLHARPAGSAAQAHKKSFFSTQWNAAVQVHKTQASPVVVCNEASATCTSMRACASAGAASLGKLHMVNLAAPEQAERMGDASLDAVISCMQVHKSCLCLMHMLA